MIKIYLCIITHKMRTIDDIENISCKRASAELDESYSGHRAESRKHSVADDYLEDEEDRVFHGGELPGDNDFAVPEEPRSYGGLNPPNGYKIGDIYVKLALANEARNIEDKVNSLYQKPDDRISVLKQAANDYKAKTEQSIKDYISTKEEIVNLEKDLMDLNQKLYNNQQDPDADMLENHSLKMNIKLTETVIKADQEKQHYNYTRMEMLERYFSRISVELVKSENGQPTPGFRMLQDDDQTV